MSSSHAIPVDAQLSSTGGILGLIMLVTGLAGVPGCILLLLRGGHLILGTDRLQYATRNGRVLT